MREPTAIMMFMGMLLFVSVPVVWSLMHASKKREFAHRERMKALEMGLLPPGEYAAPAAACVAVGAGVPVGALVVALIATLNAPFGRGESDSVLAWSTQQSSVYYGCVWGAAISVGIMGVIAGALMSWFLLGRKMSHGQATPPVQKPLYEMDSYDTVASRG